MNHPALFNTAADLTSATTDAYEGKGVVARVVAWFNAKVNAERDAEIAAFIDQRGGQFTDEMEREISRRFGGMAG
jgi:hypothetical protein